MTHLLTNIEKLTQIQQMLKTVDHTITLPRIVCIGAQSSGKSSILEKLIQRDILPKGKDITTRCPIEINTRKSDTGYEYVIINDMLVKNFSKVKQHIINAMDNNCGQGRVISTKKVVIDVYLLNSIEISLIDLPGLTKIPLEGQPLDIDLQLERLAIDHIKDENVIIMAVVPANIDISTADILKLCKRVDPEGNRTLGVLTKIDLMDKDTDCIDILKNKVTKLKNGYVGVINRGQSQLNKNCQLIAHLDHEKKYFETNIIYKALNPNIGTAYLIERINSIFSNLLETELPKLKTAINKSLDIIEEQLSQHSVEHSKADIFNKYSKLIRNILKEKYIKNNVLFRYNQSRSLVVDFKTCFQIETVEYFFDDKLKDEIRNSNSVFISEKIFKKIVSDRFSTLRNSIFNSFEHSMHVIFKHVLSIKSEYYKNLPTAFSDKIKRILFNQNNMLKSEYDRFLLIQDSFINVSHPDFCKQSILRDVLQKYVNSKKIKSIDRGIMFFFNSDKKDTIEIDEKFDISLLFDFSNTYFECYRKFFVDHGMKMAHFYFIDHLINVFKESKNMMGVDNEFFKEDEEVMKKIYESVKVKEVSMAILDILNQ